jgi:PIN domain nuclease of toxin-antitoxin system
MAQGEPMILDTCALLWLASGHKKLSRAALKQINQAPRLYVSAISGFEVAIKAARGKLKLPLPAQEWFNQVADHHGIAILPLELDTCIAAAQLPPIHDDPCDRFIIATAKLNGLAVVTADERFERYGVDVLL